VLEISPTPLRPVALGPAQVEHLPRDDAGRVAVLLDEARAAFADHDCDRTLARARAANNLAGGRHGEALRLVGTCHCILGQVDRAERTLGRMDRPGDKQQVRDECARRGHALP
jgi:hypothetical protein